MARRAAIRRFIIQHAGDERTIARRMLLALYRGELTVSEAAGLLKHVFRLAHFITVFEYLTVYLIATKGSALPATGITNSPRAQALYPAIAQWLRQCFVEGKLSMPPVNETQGMVFIDSVLDGAEAHLLSIRAGNEARRVAELRRTVDEVWRANGAQWVLSSTFSSNIGHFAYAASLITLRNAGLLRAPRIVMLRGETRNPALRRRFESHMIEALPPGVQYAEMISARKRHQLAAGRIVTMSEVVSEAVRRWVSGNPFLRPDPQQVDAGAAALEALGVPAGQRIVTIHVRQDGYNDNVAGLMRLRDARFEDYLPAIRRLVSAGFTVVRLGDPSMTRAPQTDGLIDYPFTAAKSDWMDVYLAGRCDFHIGTSSGMSFIPLMFGRPVLFTNWPTLAHMVCAPAVVTLPKVLRTARGETVSFDVFCRDHGEILEVSDAILHDVMFDDNDPRDLADAATMMAEHLDPATGRVAFSREAFERTTGILAASPLRIRPQIPDWFLDRHYGPGGS